MEAGAAAFPWNLLMNPSKSGPASSLSPKRLTQKGDKQELQKWLSALSGITSPHWGTRELGHLTQLSWLRPGAGGSDLSMNTSQVNQAQSPQSDLWFFSQRQGHIRFQSSFLRGALPDP